MTAATEQYRRPTDEELRERVFVLDDPHTQPDLVAHIPVGVSVVRIINTYRYSLYPSDKAYCAKCGAKRHRDGFTVELEDGTAALLGSTCGAELWGHSWNEAHARFQNELDRAGIVLDIQRILPELRAIRAALEEWKPSVERLAAHQKLFRGRLGKLYQMMSSAAARSDHCVVAQERVRDYEAEDAFRQRTGDLPQHHIYKMQERTVVRIEGAAYFQITNPKSELDAALKLIDDAIQVGADTQAHSQNKLRAHRLQLGEARERLDRVTQALRGELRFFRDDNARPVTFWANSIVGQNDLYEFEAGLIVDRFRDVSIGLDPLYHMVDTDPLRRLADLKG